MKRNKTYKEKFGKVNKTHEKKNREGFPAYSRPPKVEALEAMMTGTAGNKFYTTGIQTIEETLDSLRKIDDTEYIAKAAKYARNKGYMKDMPIASTVVVSKRNPELFKKIVHDVMWTPRDWVKFIDISRSGTIRDGLGRAPKREIKKAIADMDAYHAIKYPSDVKDMIRIARPPEEVNPEVINYIMEDDHTGDEKLEKLKKLKEAEDSESQAEIIEEGDLPYEVVTGCVDGIDENIWKSLLYVAPYFNMLRNLNNFERNDVFSDEDALKYAKNKLTSEYHVKNSSLFPTRFYMAYKMIEQFEGSTEIKNALEKAIELSVENVPDIEGKVALLPDKSGSMGSRTTGNKSIMQCIDLVGIFTGIMINKSDEVSEVLPFDNDVDHETGKRALEQESIMDTADQFMASGGTSMAAPMTYMVDNDIKVDKVIGFTDQEEWISSYGHESFEDAMLEYLEMYPDTEFYLITLTPYKDYTTKEHPNVHYIFGWSDKILDFVGTDINKQMEKVENHDLE